MKTDFATSSELDRGPHIRAAAFSADSRLREQALAQYRDQGFLIVDDVFSPDEISRMRDVWSGVSDERRRQGKRPEATLLMLHLLNPDLAAIVRQPMLLRCVEGFLGGQVELIQSQLMYGAPGAKGFSPHQDNYYNRATPEDGIVAAWFALEGVDEDNGALAVYPGSHRHGLVATRRDWIYLLSRSPDVMRSVIRFASGKRGQEPDDSSVMERFVYAESPGSVTPVPVRLNAGSVVFMHGNVIHSSYPNRTADRYRRSLLTNFIRVGTTFSAGKLTGRAPFDVYARS